MCCHVWRSVTECVSWRVPAITQRIASSSMHGRYPQTSDSHCSQIGIPNPWSLELRSGGSVESCGPLNSTVIAANRIQDLHFDNREV